MAPHDAAAAGWCLLVPRDRSVAAFIDQAGRVPRLYTATSQGPSTLAVAAIICRETYWARTPNWPVTALVHVMLPVAPAPRAAAREPHSTLLQRGEGTGVGASSKSVPC